MTPQEKAQELLLKFAFKGAQHEGEAKKFALIAVDEIMKAPFENTYLELVPDDAPDTDWFWDKFIEYWEQVKHEIEKL